MPAPDARADAEATVCADALRLDGITVRFGRTVALDGVTLRVPRGSMVGLIGRNGAGKSTAIRVLAGILPPNTGTAEVLGMHFGDAAAEIRRRTGYLLSEPALFPYLTPRETLHFLAEAYGLARAESHRRTEALLGFFGLGDAAERVVDGFSTGMQKRLAIAAALVHGPRLLVLDEPFESLDPLMVRALKQLLLRYAAAGGSVLLSSHLIDAVDEICDRIVILERGRTVAAGSTVEVKAAAAERLGRGTLEELYASVVAAEVAPELDWVVGEG